MVRTLTQKESLTQKEKAKVLWDYGFKTPLSLTNKMNIPQRSVKLYVSDFPKGENGDRKKCPARKKTAQSTAKVRKVMPQRIEWPGQSPDLSPIENIWGWLKNEVNKDMPKIVDSLKKSIKKHWKRLDEDFLVPYFQSMNDRMKMVIENEGGKINQ